MDSHEDFFKYKLIHEHILKINKILKNTSKQTNTIHISCPVSKVIIHHIRVPALSFYVIYVSIWKKIYVVAWLYCILNFKIQKYFESHWKKTHQDKKQKKTLKSFKLLTQFNLKIWINMYIHRICTKENWNIKILTVNKCSHYIRH